MSQHRKRRARTCWPLCARCAIAAGLSLRGAAAAFSVSPATAHRWWHRWREASEEARGDAVLSLRSLKPAALLAAAARARARRGDLRLSASDRLAATAGRQRDRLLPL